MNTHIIDPLKNKIGFTIIELMIAVGLIAILAAIAIPSYVGIQKKAARSEAKANLEAIALVLEGYMAENNNYGNGVYTYMGGSFGHTADIENVAKLGDNLLYQYRLVATQVPAPAFSLFAVPDPNGRLAGDVTFSLDSNGNKSPSDW